MDENLARQFSPVNEFLLQFLSGSVSKTFTASGKKSSNEMIPEEYSMTASLKGFRNAEWPRRVLNCIKVVNKR